jgi:hypothetical protein
LLLVDLKPNDVVVYWGKALGTLRLQFFEPAKSLLLFKCEEDFEPFWRVRVKRCDIDRSFVCSRDFRINIGSVAKEKLDDLALCEILRAIGIAALTCRAL